MALGRTTDADEREALTLAQCPACTGQGWTHEPIPTEGYRRFKAYQTSGCRWCGGTDKERGSGLVSASRRTAWMMLFPRPNNASGLQARPINTPTITVKPTGDPRGNAAK